MASSWISNALGFRLRPWRWRWRYRCARGSWLRAGKVIRISLLFSRRWSLIGRGWFRAGRCSRSGAICSSISGFLASQCISSAGRKTHSAWCGLRWILTVPAKLFPLSSLYRPHSGLSEIPFTVSCAVHYRSVSRPSPCPIFWKFSLSPSWTSKSATCWLDRKVAIRGKELRAGQRSGLF